MRYQVGWFIPFFVMGALLAGPVVDGEGSSDEFLTEIEGELTNLSLCERSSTQSPCDETAEMLRQHVVSPVSPICFASLMPCLSRATVSLECMQAAGVGPAVAPLADGNMNDEVMAACGVGAKRAREENSPAQDTTPKKMRCQRPGTPAPWK